MPNNILNLISKAVSGNGKLLETTQNPTFRNCGWTLGKYPSKDQVNKSISFTVDLTLSKFKWEKFLKTRIPTLVETFKILLYFSAYILQTLGDQADTKKLTETPMMWLNTKFPSEINEI